MFVIAEAQKKQRPFSRKGTGSRRVLNYKKTLQKISRNV